MSTKSYAIVRGRRYDKIVSVDSHGRNAEIFIDLITGIWHPAASWSAPNKRHYITEHERAMWLERLGEEGLKE